MPLRLVCPSCRATLLLPERLTRGQVHCKECQHIFTIPPPSISTQPQAGGKGRKRLPRRMVLVGMVVGILVLGAAAAFVWLLAARNVTAGPPLVRAPSKALLITPAPLKEAKVTLALPGKIRDVCVELYVSANGRTIGMRSAEGGTPSGLQSVLLDGNSLRVLYKHTEAGYILPSPDGRILYTHDGLYTNALKRLGEDTKEPWDPALVTPVLVPAMHGDFFLSVKMPAGSGRGQPEKPSFGLHMARDMRPLANLRDLDGFEESDRRQERPRSIGDPDKPLPLYKRRFLSPTPS